MIYLSGAIDARLIRPGFGFMFSPATGNRVPDGVPWAADNGAFAERWTIEAQLRMLERHSHARQWCLFAVLPDVYNDAGATRERSLAHLARLGESGYPLAYVLQPGVRSDELPWADLAAVFVGGSLTTWKFAPETLAIVAEAKSRGLWAHCGRVNSLRRMLHAKAAGFDSVDGTTALFKRRYLSRLPAWHAIAEAQLAL